MRNREGWEVKMLGEVCEVSNGFAFKSNLFKSDGSPIIRISNIQDDKVYLDDVVFFDKSDYKIDLEKFMITKGDILIAMSGATTGKIGLYQQEKASYLNQRVGCIRTTEFVDKKFIFYYLKTLVEEILRLASGVAQPNISTSQLKSFRIPLPPLPTQHQIVSELDTLNYIIDKKKEQLNELDNLAQATFYDMFGDPVENEKGWEVKKLGDISDLKAGVFVKADDIYPIYEESLFQCYGGNGIRGYVETSTHEGEFVLIGRQGALCGNVKKAVGKFHATEHAVVCTPIIEYNIDWFYFTLFFMNLNQYATGAAQPGLSVRKLVTIDISVPSLPLQTQFAEKIKHIEQQKALIQRSIDDVQQLFDYTMDKYFN